MKLKISEHGIFINRFMRKQIIKTALLAVISLFKVEAQNTNALIKPESVTSDGKYLYVTNMGKGESFTDKDGDGFVSKLSLDGKLLNKSITNEKLNSPKGTAIISGILYVADMDKIVGIRLSDGKKTGEIDFSSQHTLILNDIAIKNRNTLFVSATDIGKIFEVNVSTRKITPVADMKGANGLYYDSKSQQLYACNFIFDDLKGGEIGVIKWRKHIPEYKRIGDFKGAFDGIIKINSQTLLVSDWRVQKPESGVILKINLTTLDSKNLELPLLGGPADFYADKKKHYLAIPELIENKVLIKKW